MAFLASSNCTLFMPVFLSFLSRSFSHFLPYSLWLWYISHFPICEDTPAVLLLSPFGIWSKSNSYYIHSKNEIPESPEKLDQETAVTCDSFYLLMFKHQPCPLIVPHLSLSLQLIYVFSSYSYTCSGLKWCQQTPMLLWSPLIYVIITKHSVPCPRHWRMYEVSLPGAFCRAEETDGNKHTDVMSSGRSSVKEQRVGWGDPGWRGFCFGEGAMADAQHRADIPSAFTSTLQRLLPWFPEMSYLKMIFPAVAMGECLAYKPGKLNVLVISRPWKNSLSRCQCPQKLG